MTEVALKGAGDAILTRDCHYLILRAIFTLLPFVMLSFHSHHVDTFGMKQLATISDASYNGLRFFTHPTDLGNRRLVGLLLLKWSWFRQLLLLLSRRGTTSRPYILSFSILIWSHHYLKKGIRTISEHHALGIGLPLVVLPSMIVCELWRVSWWVNLLRVHTRGSLLGPPLLVLLIWILIEPSRVLLLLLLVSLDFCVCLHVFFSDFLG